MRDSDVLDNNPHVSRSALEAMHGQVFGWALSRCDFEQTVAEDLVQQAYVELLTGKARFDGKSSLKTFVFAVVQNLSRNRYRRMATRMRLLEQAGSETAPDVGSLAEPGQYDENDVEEWVFRLIDLLVGPPTLRALPVQRPAH